MTKLLAIFCFICIASANAQTAKLEQTIHQNWQFRQMGKSENYPARVPGCIHTDLMSNQLISDPYFRDNEKLVQWVEQEDWEYHTYFDVARDMFEKPNIQITFKGLDTYADVYLNDSLILKADNMYRLWTEDCKKFLKIKNNSLRIMFHSAVNEGLEMASKFSYRLPIHDVKPISNERKEKLKRADSQTRKAPCQFGWDTHPRLVTCGIWRPVILTAWSGAKMEDVFVEPVNIETRQANYNVRANITADTTKEYKLSVYLDNSVKPVSQKTVLLKSGTNNESLKLFIPNPQLWWPNGMGKPNLYSVKVILSDERGRLDEITEKIGVRTIEVVQDKDSIGRSFYFRINGLPLFVKGSNHVPADALVSSISDKQYEDLVNDAVDANLNMLRVWGGAIYENDVFYDLCDKAGILVWEDFMFANAMYPGDNAFLNNVKQEAICNVKRLRNHPSIALWSGNNEILTSWITHKFGKKPEFNITKSDSAKIFQDYLKIFQDILPGVVKQYNPQTLYWSSSPQSEPGVVSSLLSGDYHYYKVWHGFASVQNYKIVIPRFMGEYGVQSLPSYFTLQKYLVPEDENLFSPVMAFRQKDPRGNEKLMRYLREDYKAPRDFQSLVYLSQIFQADALKIAIEAHRINKPKCMGSMFWQFGDSWPNIGWSVVDYLGKKKAAFYSVKEAFRNISVIPALSDTAVVAGTLLKVYINSDSAKAIDGKLMVKVLDFSGKLIFSKELNVKVVPFSNDIYFSIHVRELLKGLNKEELVLSTVLTKGGLALSKNLLYFNHPKFLQLQKPDIKTKIVQNTGGFEIELSAK